MKSGTVGSEARADVIETGFGNCSDVGLQLFGESLSDLSFSVKRIVVVVQPRVLLRQYQQRSSHKYKQPSRNETHKPRQRRVARIRIGPRSVTDVDENHSP